MKLIVKRLEVRNFKVFEMLELSLDSDHLIVLDGPNGFGKSSFFDAMELLLTGKIRRYIELEALTVDRRSLKSGCPWLFNQTGEDDWLSVRAEIVLDGQSRILERAASKSELDRHRGITDLKLPLFELTDFKAERGEAIEQEEFYLSDLLGEQYLRDFELFHYVEQEENTRLLKQKEKDRQSQIAHLFDIGDIQDKMNNIVLALTKIGKLCNAQKEAELRQHKEKWETAKLQILPAGIPVAYERLIAITDQPWDRDVPEFDVRQFQQWLSEDGELFHIERFRGNFAHYQNALYNNELLKRLLPQKELLHRFLMFARPLEYRERGISEVACFDAAMALSDAFRDIIKAVSEDRLAIPFPLVPILPENLSMEQFQQQVAELKQQLTTTDKVHTCHAALMHTREQLVSAFREHQTQCEPTTICPTCGHHWATTEALFESIDKQGDLLETLSLQQDNNLSLALASFRQNVQEPVERAIQHYLQQTDESIESKRLMTHLSVEQRQWIEHYKQHLQTAGVVFQDLLSENFDPVKPQTLDELDRRVRESCRPVDDSCIHDDFDMIYREIFNNDPLAVEQVTIRQIELKKAYLGQQHAVASSDYVAECEKAYNKADLQMKKACRVREHLRKLKRIYEDEKRVYLEAIVKEIEILFHIYSGRLMQSYQQGLGIFIENDGNTISFNETPGHGYDAVFSMSSGQLSALVLSFTLALNKRYAKNSLLLVDDPVQTLDEINVAGFIELLRTEFADRQIIMSTHEDRMSAYFRYKYKKFGMPACRINFMEEARSAIGRQ
jgi:DNA repair exonuclease SbcCD ATPase subunit